MSKNLVGALVDFVDDGGTESSRLSKFLASFYGSFLFHFVLLMLLMSRTKIVPAEDLIPLAGPLLFILSILFGLIISTGNKGGLIRRFWYGVTLPAICYYLAVGIAQLAYLKQ